jgi:hypothetical protein
MSVLTLSNHGQKYVSWKDTAKNAAVPVWSKPVPTADGPAFKARPINHYRKRLMPSSESGTGNSAVGMPVDRPGGSVILGTTACDDEKYVLKTTINNDSDCATCNPTKSSSTKLEKTYYTDSRAYLRARCQTFDQKTKIGEKNGDFYKSTNCYNLSGCENKQNVVFKPNNKKFATQGAVSSGTRLQRLKVDTITRNASSLSAYGHAAQNAGRYNGNFTAPYFLKSKDNKCTPFRRNGKMTMCF